MTNNINKVLVLTALASTNLLTGCVPAGVYQPPQAPQTLDYSREVNANFDATWSAITNVAGATFFNIKNFDKGSGLMTLEYDNMRGNVGAYVTCGEFVSTQAAYKNPHPDPKSAINYMTISDVQMHLSGRANVMARPVSDTKTNIQINSQYTLKITQKIGDRIESIGEWNFTSREPDTKTVDVAYKPTNVTCQSSNKLENDFLTEVTARLPTNITSTPVEKPLAPVSKKRTRK
ncbi:MAG: hypothetical protein PHR94_15665 [Methylomonas lenta]|nr:hypothetical protein [Methylomonas lenta]